MEAEERLARGHRPGPGAHLPVVEGDLARAGEEERHGVLGDLLDAIRRIVGDDDAGRGRGVQVYGIHADAVAGDDPALRHLRHDLGRDRPGVGIEERVAIRGLAQELLGLLGLQRHELRHSRQDLLLDVQGFPDVVRQNDFCHISLSASVTREP
jgi:hypothetical protein